MNGKKRAIRKKIDPELESLMYRINSAVIREEKEKAEALRKEREERFPDWEQQYGIPKVKEK